MLRRFVVLLTRSRGACVDGVLCAERIIAPSGVSGVQLLALISRMRVLAEAKKKTTNTTTVFMPKEQCAYWRWIDDKADAAGVICLIFFEA